MKSDLQDALRSLRSGSIDRFDRVAPPGIASIEHTAPLRNAFRVGVVYLTAATIAFLGELYLAFQNQVWQYFAIAGIGATLTLVAAVSVILIWRRQPRLGIRLLIGASLAAVLGTPFLITGFGLILGLGTILVILTIALESLPQKEANRVLFISVGVAIVAGGLDLLSPPTQQPVPAFRDLILSLGGVMIFFYGILIVRHFNSYPLATKLILAFLVVSLLPLTGLALLNDRHFRTVLTEQAQQALLAAVSTTAADIDAFIHDNLEAIQTEAQLPALSAYLRLPPEQRADSPQAAAVAATLQELQRKDKVFIDSYALLDETGQNLIDTYEPNTGQIEADRDYFSKPLETGLPYLSPVQFEPLQPNETASLSKSAVLYFSSPVRDSLTRETLGVLRMRYQANILQKLIVQNNGLVGEQSFAILFDENYVRLAHGSAPTLLFKAATPLEPEEMIRLQVARRLPNRPAEELATDLPALAAGLDNAIFDPSFTTPLVAVDERLNLAVVKELETQPWLVVFAQPQSRFLAPIQAQTRTTFFLAIIIAGAVAAAAFVMGQFLARPLVYLTQVVTRFTEGDLTARARPHVKLGDETGILAASFDKMARQVGRLLQNLAERTQELETEIGERKRAEAELQASESKYRTLVEESKDMIFMATPTGKITDVNPAGVDLSGYPKAELIQRHIEDLFTAEEDRRRFEQTLLAQGAVGDFEVKLCKKEGAVVNCLITATIRHAEDGTVLGYQGIIRDVTGQKQVEKERLRLSAIEQELIIAQDIQHRLLPPPHPAWADLDVVCYSNPAREMGGDFYAYHAFEQGVRPPVRGIQEREAASAKPAPPSLAFSRASSDLSSPGAGRREGKTGGANPNSSVVNSQLPLSSDYSPKYAIAVGDVSGKGMPAALLMAVSLASFQSIIGQGLAPGDLLAHLNQAISLYTRTTRQNCALVYVEISPPDRSQAGVLRVVNAGCVMPLIRRTTGPVAWVEAYGTPLGVALSAELGHEVVEVGLTRGDLVILVSDGVIEATSAAGEMFSFDRLEETIASGPRASAAAMLEHLRQTITGFVDDTEPHDDLTMVVVKV